jgi:hypothetical protein
MDEQFFDNLAKGLDDGTISRRRALKLVGAAAFGAALVPLFPRQADARTSARKRCKRKGGLWLSATDPASPCRCASTCEGGGGLVLCPGSESCLCFRNVETGRGFCVGGSAPSTAPSSSCSGKADCPENTTCVYWTGCGGSGKSCINGADCATLSKTFGCVNGTCQQTFCAFPCATL